MQLSALASKFQADKLEHHFVEAYHDIMKDYRDAPVKLMEVGVHYGASMKMWWEYFPHGKIVGVDWFEGKHGGGASFSEPMRFASEAETLGRIELCKCNQSDRDQLLQLASKYEKGSFDFIIDDGSHRMKDQQLTMASLWDLVKPGGFYIIEDIHTSLMRHWYEIDADDSNTTLTMCNQFAQTGMISSRYMDRLEEQKLTKEIESCKQFWYNQDKVYPSGTVIFRKKTD